MNEAKLALDRVEDATRETGEAAQILLRLLGIGTLTEAEERGFQWASPGGPNEQLMVNAASVLHAAKLLHARAAKLAPTTTATATLSGWEAREAEIRARVKTALDYCLSSFSPQVPAQDAGDLLTEITRLRAQLARASKVTRTADELDAALSGVTDEEEAERIVAAHRPGE